MDDSQFKRALYDQLASERLQGAHWVLHALSARAQRKDPLSPEGLELLRAMNSIQAQLGSLRGEAVADYDRRGL